MSHSDASASVPMSKSVLIEARALCKHFAAAEAVNRVSLGVSGGEIYGLIGPNGAGKTTTLRMLAGLMQPTSGVALIDGLPATADAARRQLGFLTGSTGLYGRLTPVEVLEYFGQLYGLGRGDIRARTADLARTLEITHLLGRPCEKLSTGEKQRVSLARATIHDPLVLILDEPTAGLDVLASRFVVDFVRRARARGRAVMFSTHYLSEAELLCDRIGMIYRGELLLEGSPLELKQQLEATSLEQAFLNLVERCQ